MKARLSGPWPLALPLLVLGLRWASFLPSVIDWDESLYLSGARMAARQLAAFGVWDMHPVGAPAMIAAAFLLLGEHLEAVRLLGAACVGGHRLRPVRAGAPGRRAAQPRYGAALALRRAFRAAGRAGLQHRDPVRADGRLGPGLALRSRRRLASADAWGVLIGLALLVKPVAAPEGCLAFALLAWPTLASRDWRRLGRWRWPMRALCAAPTLLVGASMPHAGAGRLVRQLIEAPSSTRMGACPALARLAHHRSRRSALRWLLAGGLAPSPLRGPGGAAR
jgi:hypothetical protein